MVAKKDGIITKSYLDKRLGKFKTELKTELRTELKYDIGEFKDEMKNKLYDIKDKIVGEIKNMREEFNTHQFSHNGSCQNSAGLQAFTYVQVLEFPKDQDRF